MVSERDVSLQDAVGSYLFNSQLLSHADQQMSLVVPGECRENPAVSAYLDTLIADTTNPISKVQVFDLKQSMKNGGGPACLRLRVALNDRELAAVNPATLMSDALYQRLVAWVDSHYRDRLSTDDLADPQLLIESRTALDALTQILNVGSIYDFQRL
jgi:succinylarginine dihydrolase